LPTYTTCPPRACSRARAESDLTVAVDEGIQADACADEVQALAERARDGLAELRPDPRTAKIAPASATARSVALRTRGDLSALATSVP
jgi:hypothetical protein